MSDGMAKNLEVVREEIADYRVQIAVQMDRMKRSPNNRKLHILFGLLPDAHRLMPRTLSYLAVASIPVGALLWWLL